MADTLTHDSAGLAICQECSDSIGPDEPMVRTAAGLAHPDCARQAAHDRARERAAEAA